MKSEVFDVFPTWMALIGLGLAWAIYALGVYVLSHLGVPVGLAYLGYCVFMEVAIVRRSCAHCYYYGKMCGLGRGRLCSLVVKRGDPSKFLRREFSFLCLIPDLLVSIIPLVGGIVALVRHFNWGVLVAMVAILVLASFGTGLVRGNLACRYCAQRELGCPAEKWFSKRRARPHRRFRHSAGYALQPPSEVAPPIVLPT
jgi:hypothetical protein